MAKFKNANGNDLLHEVNGIKTLMIPCLKNIKNINDLLSCLQSIKEIKIKVKSNNLVYNRMGVPYSNVIPIDSDCITEEKHVIRYSLEIQNVFDPGFIDDLEIFYLKTVHGPIIIFDLVNFEIINEFYNIAIAGCPGFGEILENQVITVNSLGNKEKGYIIFKSYSDINKHFMILSEHAELLSHPVYCNNDLINS